jgi:hypothetical protein
MLCKLVFLLQSIKDYHLPEEYAFYTINDELMNTIQHRYTLIINTGVQLLRNQGICNVQPLYPQSEGDPSNDSSDDERINARVSQHESALGDAIKSWLSGSQFQPPDDQHSNDEHPDDENPAEVDFHELLRPSDLPQPKSDKHSDQVDVRSSDHPAAKLLLEPVLDDANWLSDYFQAAEEPGKDFQTYKNMKVIILLHALSLVSRGRDARIKWRKPTAEIMIKLHTDRFTICLGIIHSLFLRRLKAIPNVDNETARKKLIKISGYLNLWKPGVDNPRKRQMGYYLMHIIKPSNYPGTFWFPSTGRVYSQVLKNVEIYIRETIWYVIFLRGLAPKDMYLNSTWARRIGEIQTLVKEFWKHLKLEAGLEAGQIDDNLTVFKLEQLLESKDDW